jgi:hypothetical protein
VLLPSSARATWAECQDHQAAFQGVVSQASARWWPEASRLFQDQPLSGGKSHPWNPKAGRLMEDVLSFHPSLGARHSADNQASLTVPSDFRLARTKVRSKSR